MKQVRIESRAHKMLNKICNKRKKERNLVNNQKDVVEELITTEYDKEFRK